LSAGDLSSGEARIDTALVRGLIAGQFPRWAYLPVAPAGSQGVDNATYRLGERMSVRLPRFARWDGQVAREQRWLPLLAPHLPLPVPVPLAKGEPTREYPFSWSVYQWIDGERAVPETLTDPHRTAIDLAEFFAALQRIDTAGGPPPEWSNGFRGVAARDERDSAIVRTRVRSKIAALEGMIDTGAVTAVYETALAAPPWDKPPVWIHGDPAPGNLLAVDGRLSAVIDFGTVAVGDPACDLIAAWTWLNTESRDVFRKALRVDAATWARGRGWGLTALLPAPAELSGADPARAARVLRRLDDLVADHRNDCATTLSGG
jgi:aminoglycoside phosphotransferase (APT) family kinase protein